jgi:putative endonuclease
MTAKTFNVYLCRCADDTLYCGISMDVEARIATHNSGKGARYTRGRLPVTLVYQEECGTISDALRRECAIKKLSRAAKEKLIANAVH